MIASRFVKTDPLKHELKQKYLILSFPSVWN